MSHISTYSEIIKDRILFLECCKKIGAKVFTQLDNKTFNVYQYGNNSIKSIASILIPGWKYDIALTEKGELKYDHWGSTSDSMKLLHSAMVDYKTEIIKKSIPLEAENFTICKDNENEEVIIEVFY